MISFTAHLESVEETYWQHFRHAIGFSATLLGAAIACGIHAFLPFLFETTGSERVRTLHDKMVVNRKNLTPAAHKRRRRAASDQQQVA